MNIKFQKAIAVSMVIGFSMQLTACGTILYPERKGQQSGKLDPGVVVLNAVGLLFFLVPGVIAFAVDFNNGTIYLPAGSASISQDKETTIYIDGELTNEKIEQAIYAQTGKVVDINESQVQPLQSSNTAFNNDIRFL